MTTIAIEIDWCPDGCGYKCSIYVQPGRHAAHFNAQGKFVNCIGMEISTEVPR